MDGPKKSGRYSRPEDLMIVDCAESLRTGVTGKCQISMELFQPQKNSYSFGCEVSGERPMFRMEKKSIVIEAFVPPTEALVEVGSQNAESGRVMLNCTSSGLPSPNLVWTIDDQKVPHDFTGKVWNATSKLWHAWSLLSYSPSDEHTAVCTPEISRENQIVKGQSAEYSSAGSNVKEAMSQVLAVSISMLLLR